MNKKLVCLMLSVLMLLPFVLTGCSTQQENEETTGETVDNSAKTIVMWLVTEEETTPAAQKLVQEAFTKITKAKFKTNVVLKFCTEKEYYTMLENAIESEQADQQLREEAEKELRKYLKAHKNEKDEDELTQDFLAANPKYVGYIDLSADDEDESTAVTEEETETNEWGISEIKYPEPKENQVDIFYLASYDRYVDYAGREWLASLDEELGAASKKLTDYISAPLLQGVQLNGVVYAIPNNVMIGEYTYMMIDKKLYDEHLQNLDKVKTVLDLYQYLSFVELANEYNGKTPDDEGYVVPLASTYEECLKMLCWFWDLSYTDQTVYDMYWDKDAERYYVSKYSYTVEKETMDDEGNVKQEQVTLWSNYGLAGEIYQTNSDGQYVDANGNALNYHYETDAEMGWAYNDNNGKYEKTEEAKGALYLVDADGNAVTPETDRRVKVSAETREDSDGNVRPTHYYYYNADADFSILGAMTKDPADRNRGSITLGFNSLFSDEEYRDMYATLKDYEYRGFFGEVKEGQTAAVSFVKGDAHIKYACDEDGVYTDANGKSYYVVIAEYPEATEEELYGNMFAVYANSPYLTRAMEVITYLNTNAELRNLLQYGVQGTHYELTEDGRVRLLNKSEKDGGVYRMDIEKTGNCFIAKPTVDMEADVWEYAKLQNNDALINPLLGFNFNTMIAESDYNLDIELIDHIKALNADAEEQVAQCGSKAELITLMTDRQTGFVKLFAASGDAKIKKAVSSDYNPDEPLGPDVPNQEPDKSGHSPYAIYQTWLNNYGYAAK